MWWSSKEKYPGEVFLSYLALLAVLFIHTACGYRFVGMEEQGASRKEPGGAGFHKIAIPISEGDSTFPGLEAAFTTAFREEFASRSGLRLVSKEEADVILEAKISRIKTTPSAYSVEQFNIGGLATEYETTSKRTLMVRLEARLIHKGSGKVIWKDSRIEERSSYPVGKDPLVNIHHERRAYIDIAKRLARRIFLKTVERF